MINSKQTKVPLKRLFNVINGSTPKSDNPDFWDGAIVWVTPEDIGNLNDGRIRTSRRMITESGYRSCGTSLVPEGSIVLTTRAPIGNVALAQVPLCTNQGCKSLVPLSSDIDTRFFYYQIQSLSGQLNALGNGTTFIELSSSELRRVSLFVPSRDMQRAIADFLDRETARADALVAKYERLIDLLEEKRTAHITEAVTKGLDPRVPMKETCVPWIGDIPEHWQIWPLKYVLHDPLANGIFVKRDQFGNGVPLVNVFDVYQNRGRINDQDLDRVDIDANQAAQYELRSGDIVLVRSSLKQEGVAATALFSGAAEPCVFECHLVRIRPSAAVLPQFLHAFLQSHPCRSRMISFANTTTMTTIAQPAIAPTPVCLPPLDEQREIVSHLATITNDIDALILKTRRAISLLREYRDTMISEALIGQLPVGQGTARQALGGIPA